VVPAFEPAGKSGFPAASSCGQEFSANPQPEISSNTRERHPHPAATRHSGASNLSATCQQPDTDRKAKMLKTEMLKTEAGF
jgi:hypothetical protein